MYRDVRLEGVVAVEQGTGTALKAATDATPAPSFGSF